MDESLFWAEVGQFFRRLETEGFELQFSESSKRSLAHQLTVYIKKKTGEKFMEDRIVVGLMDSLTTEPGKYPNRIAMDAEEIEKLPKGYNGYIMTDFWGKSTTGITYEDYETIRCHINNIATLLHLIKIFNWGCDDGGIAVFTTEGQLVYRTYWDQDHVVFNEFGPQTEDEYWEQVEENVW